MLHQLAPAVSVLGNGWKWRKRNSLVACETAHHHGYVIASASLAANASNEDRWTAVDGRRWTVAAVFDGHGGSGVSQYLVDKLPAEVLQTLDIQKEGDVSSITRAFRTVDDSLHALVFDTQKNSIFPHEGSCALAAVMSADTIHVANCGDSRAFLIEAAALSAPAKPQRDDGEEIIPAHSRFVSELHTADSETEQSRLRSLHPLEKDVVHCRQKIVEMDANGTVVSTRWGACYVKGRLQPTRAFGDFYLKEVDMEVLSDFCPHLIPDSGKFTPPYIDAVPTIVSFPRKPGDVLILATDGLWDYLTPAMVMEIVKTNPSTTVANALIEAALVVATESSGEISLAELKAMEPGIARRNIHDDITVVVIYT